MADRGAVGESAGLHLVESVVRAREHESAGAVRERLMAGRPSALDAIYVVDAGGLLRGAVPLCELFAASEDRPVGELVDRSYPRVRYDEDQEHAAAEALDRNATSVAVVDAEGRLLGAITALALLRILRHEHVEDLHRLAGIRHESMRSLEALEAPPARRARHRLPWLLVGLAGSMVATVVVSRFELLLQTHLAVAFFVPAIVYLADAIGTQTESIVVRGLSLSRLSLRHLLTAELRTGVLIGATLGALALPFIAWTFDLALAAVVAVAILAAGAMATTIGLLLPWALQRFGLDPALGSGPLATIIQDVLSLFLYFTIASSVLGTAP